MEQNDRILFSEKLTSDASNQMEMRLDMKPRQPGEGEKRFPQSRWFKKEKGKKWREQRPDRTWLSSAPRGEH